MGWCRSGLGLALACAACGAEPVPAPVVAVPIEAEVAPDAWRAALSKTALEGFVLLARSGVKWPTPEAARAGEPVAPAEGFVAHAVVADLGDVVEVRPVERGDAGHCELGSYDSVERFAVRAFVRKRDLEVVLPKTAVVEGGDGTRCLAASLAGAAIVHADSGARHGCAVDDRGRVHCWGENESGQLGRATGAETSHDAALVAGLGDVSAVALGARHSCALARNGSVWCWGGPRTVLGGAAPLLATAKPVAVEGF